MALVNLDTVIEFGIRRIQYVPAFVRGNDCSGGGCGLESDTVPGPTHKSVDEGKPDPTWDQERILTHKLIRVKMMVFNIIYI